MNISRKQSWNIVLSMCLWLFSAALTAANYPLEIIQPQEGLSTTSRYYKAYPGLEYKVPVGVLGGEYPFTYQLTTAPTGMTIDESTGVILWSNPTVTGSPHSVTVRVTDYEGSTDNHSWTITVTTSGFIFIDDSATEIEDGSIENPFSSLSDVYRGTDYTSRSDRTYAGQFLYFRGGTYDPEGYTNNCPGQQCQVQWPGTDKPIVWLEYPGETAIIDHDRAADGAYFDMSSVGNASNLFIHGIKFQDMLNHAVRLIGDRATFFECEFSNLGPGIDGENSSFIMYASTGGPGGSDYGLIKDNSFYTLDTGAFIKTYSNYKLVIDSNTFRNGFGDIEGIALKAYDSNIDVRGNLIDGVRRNAINGNWASSGNVEIRFNRVLNANINYSTDIYGALTVNYHDTATAPYYIYRNTFEGTVTVRFATSDDGPFYIYGNVIVNDNSGTPSGSHITHYEVQDPSRVIIGTDPGNLVGRPEDNIIDELGNLTESYLSQLSVYGDAVSVTTALPLTSPTNLQEVVQ